MTVSRAKTSLLLTFLVILTVPAVAQTSTSAPADTSRDASFLPLAPMPATGAPIVVTAPAPAVPPITVPTVSQAPAIVAPPTAAPAAALTTVPPATVSIPPSPVTPLTSTPTPVAKSIEAATISNIDPESIGLMASAEGGLGADMWKSTSKAFVAKLFSVLNLPTPSKTLNRLALRLLLTTASVPEGTYDGNQSFTSMRVEKLLMLGDAQDAWKLASMAKPEQIDEITLRLVAEAALLSPQRDDVCSKLPDIVKAHSGVEWQKLMLVCQLRANDAKAAQVTLDLLHAQGVKDDIFFFVAEKNIMGNNKQLPRQLTPVKPLTLALLQLSGLPLPSEVYVHPDAPLIPELLAAKAREDVARIGLAERAAERGLIGSADLAGVYRSTVFTPESIAAAANSPESGPRLHALLYQAALQEKVPQNRIADALKFMQTISPALLNNAGGEILVEMLGALTPADELNQVSGVIAHIYVLAGKNETALEWLKQANHAAVSTASVTDDLNGFWPLTVFTGLETDTDYAADLNKWLDAFLKSADAKNQNPDGRMRRDQAASILLLLEADGYAVTNEAWIKVMDAPTSEKRPMPAPLFFERLRTASTSSRRGETIMLSLALAGNGNDIPALSAIETVRALRVTGLSADAAMLARETANALLAPTKL